MDAFYASIEQRDHPEWRGRPVIVGAGPHERGVVAACSYEARAFGVHSAMPSRTAGRLCPQAVFTPPDMARYAAVSHTIQAIFARFSPLVEPLSLDEAFLDVTGVRRLFGEGPAIARAIRAAIRAETGLTASVGVAHNKFLAKLASDLRKPDGLTIVPDEPAAIRAFLAPLPVGRLWGVGKVTQPLLEAAGLRTIGNIQSVSPEALSRLVGAEGALRLKALAEGLDERPVETEGIEQSLSREHTFPEDCAAPDAIAATLKDLVDDVGARLRATGRLARLARVKIRWRTFKTLTRQTRLPGAGCCDDFTLRETALTLWARVGMQQPVRLIGFGVAELTDPGATELFQRAPPARERISHAVDQLRSRFGDAAVRRGSNGT